MVNISGKQDREAGSNTSQFFFQNASSDVHFSHYFQYKKTLTILKTLQIHPGLTFQVFFYLSGNIHHRNATLRNLTIFLMDATHLMRMFKFKFPPLAKHHIMQGLLIIHGTVEHVLK